MNHNLKKDADTIIQKSIQAVLPDEARKCLSQETPKDLSNVTTVITGSVKELCSAAGNAAKKLGYEPLILTDMLSCEARDAGSFLSSIAISHRNEGKKLAFIAGGETVVHLKGKGKGGRNQEIALSAAIGLEGIKNAADGLIITGPTGTNVNDVAVVLIS